MNLCILDNDVLDAPIAPQFHSYGAMFQRLFAAAGANWQYSVFNTTRGEYPADFAPYDAVLLTGSRADSFSDAPWVQTLRGKVSALLQTEKKLIGVCFGHQLIALCLGASVGRAPQGWGAGRMQYQWHAPQFTGAQGRQTIALLASHQDQVASLPPGATLLASSPFCPVAAFAVADRVLCVQAHPEFVEDYSAYITTKLRNQFGEALFQRSIDSLAQGHEGLAMARMLIAFVEAH